MSWGSGSCEVERASIRMLAYLVLHLRESWCFSIVDRKVFVTKGIVLIGRYSKPAIPPTDRDSTTGRLHYRAARGRAARGRATRGRATRGRATRGRAARGRAPGGLVPPESKVNS